MNGEEIRVANSDRKCFYFSLRLDTFSNKSGPLHTFYVASPIKDASKEDAFLFLCHSILLTDPHLYSNVLYNLYCEEFGNCLVEEFTRHHADIFEVWELRRSALGLTIVFTDKESMWKSLLLSESTKKKRDSTTYKTPRSSHQEVLMSRMDDFSSSKRSDVPSVQLNYPRPYHSDVDQVQEELRMTKDQLRSERRLREKRGEEMDEKVTHLLQQLKEAGSTNTTELQAIVQQNEDAVAAIESETKKRTESLQEAHRQALQARDIRIAQLSESVVFLEEQHRKDVLEIQFLQQKVRVNEGAIHRGSDSPTSRLRLLEEERKYLLLERDYREVMNQQKQTELDLRAANVKIMSQSSELERASLLLKNLKDGLELVKQTIPYLTTA